MQAGHKRHIALIVPELSIPLIPRGHKIRVIARERGYTYWTIIAANINATPRSVAYTVSDQETSETQSGELNVMHINYYLMYNYVRVGGMIVRDSMVIDMSSVVCVLSSHEHMQRYPLRMGVSCKERA